MDIGKAVVLASDCSDSGIWRQLGLKSLGLMPLANEPLLCHSLRSLAAAGVNEVALVVAPGTAPHIREIAGDGAAWQLEVQYLEVPATVGALGQLRAAASFVGPEPVVVQRGDVVVHGRLARLSVGFRRERPDVLVAGLGGPMVRSRESLRLVDSPAAVQEVAMCLLGPGIVHGLESLGDSSGLVSLVAEVRASGGEVMYERIEGCLPCRDRAALLAANRRVLESLIPGSAGADILESDLQGPVRIGAGARLFRTLVRGPAIIGEGAHLSNAYVGPYTSIGPGVVVDAAEVEHSIVLPEAEIRWLDARLEGSVVGRGARVVRELRVPRAMQLLVAHGAEVSLG
jgi:glucose-1-phosphate thymidylyltransferase